MYEDYWKLKEKPFQNNFDLRFLYLSLQHEEALVRLIYSVRERSGGVILSGDYGCGKSLLLHYFLQQMRELEPGYRTIHIAEGIVGMNELCSALLHQLGSDVFGTLPRPPRLISVLQDGLLTISNKGGHTVLVIDEATLLPEETMDEMRFLVDLRHPETQAPLLSLVMSGPFEDGEIAPLLKSRALHQRMPLRCHLSRLNEEQCVEYIRRRLRVAGQGNMLFTEDALELIAEHSMGSPRNINNICDLSLCLGYFQHLVRIGPETVSAVSQEIEDSLI